MNKNERNEAARADVDAVPPEHLLSSDELVAMEKDVVPPGTALLARFFGAPTFGGRNPAEYVTPTLAGGAERRRRALQLAADTACQLIIEGTARALEADANDAIDVQHDRIEHVLKALTGAATKTRALIFLAAAYDFDGRHHAELAPWCTDEGEAGLLDIWRLFLDRFPQYENRFVDGEGDISLTVQIKIGNLLGERAARRGRPRADAPPERWPQLLSDAESLIEDPEKLSKPDNLAQLIAGARATLLSRLAGRSDE